MVIYDLICPAGHKFEGWFPGSDAFEKQISRGLVQCDVCGNTEVKKLPSGVHIAKSSSSSTSTKAPEALPPQPAAQEEIKAMAATGPMDGVVMIKALRHYVKNHFENVGKSFFNQLMGMHRGETPHKNIYGQVTPEEQEKLMEDEVSHFVLPELPPEFEN